MKIPVVSIGFLVLGAIFIFKEMDGWMWCLVFALFTSTVTEITFFESRKKK